MNFVPGAVLALHLLIMLAMAAVYWLARRRLLFSYAARRVVSLRAS